MATTEKMLAEFTHIDKAMFWLNENLYYYAEEVSAWRDSNDRPLHGLCKIPCSVCGEDFCQNKVTTDAEDLYEGYHGVYATAANTYVSYRHLPSGGWSLPICAPCSTKLIRKGSPCENCGNLVLHLTKMKLNPFSTQNICCMCVRFRRCFGCNEQYMGAMSGPISQSCPKCYSKPEAEEKPKFPRCADCGRTRYEVKHFRCSVCRRDRRLGHHNVCPTFDKFHLADEAKLYFGVEIELQPIEGLDAVLKMLGEAAPEGFVFFKHDGSIERLTGKRGFEIASAPATLSYHNQAWDWLFDNAGLFERSQGCGLHIHIDRAFLTHLQASKIMQFIHHPDNFLFIHRIARRLNESFGNYSAPRDAGEVFPSAIRARLLNKQVGHRRRDRYLGVNVSKPHTVELRIFDGVLSHAELMQNLEFTHALVYFTLPGSRGFKESLSSAAFVEYVGKHYKDYPILFSELEEGGYFN